MLMWKQESKQTENLSPPPDRFPFRHSSGFNTKSALLVKLCPFSQALESISEAYFNVRGWASSYTRTDLFWLPPHTHSTQERIPQYVAKSRFLLLFF